MNPSLRRAVIISTRLREYLPVEVCAQVGAEINTKVSGLDALGVAQVVYTKLSDPCMRLGEDQAKRAARDVVADLRTLGFVRGEDWRG